MKPLAIGLLFLSAWLLPQQLTAQTNTEYLLPVGSVLLDGVEGRLDHMAVDPASNRLFVSALENHTVEVIDLAQQMRVHQIHGILEPQGIGFIREAGLIVVGCRGDGTCRSFNARTFEPGAWVDLGRNADNIRIAAGDVYVGSGAEPGPGLLSAIDLAFLMPANQGGKQSEPLSPADLLLDRPRQAQSKCDVPLKAHPESFQVDSELHRIYVNVPDEHEIAVADSTTDGLRIAQSWPVTIAEKNFAMTLDRAGSRLFIGCRKPACIAAYDTRSGKLVAQSPCVGDVDDMFFDSQTQRLYVIGGEGFVDVFDVGASESPIRLAHTATAAKARTGLFVPESRTMVVAAPHTTEGRARILLYKIGPGHQPSPMPLNR